MRIHYFQHVPFEGLGSIEDWALERGHLLTSTKFYEKAGLPELDNIDWLIIMGGPMGVYDEEKYPWLQKEKQFIRQMITADKTVIGICLGAQLIVDVLDGKVYRNREKEIGWYPVTFDAELQKQGLFAGIEPDYMVFHWHGDTFDLPKDAVHLAYSEACRNQAFLYHEKVLGLQFHLETTVSSLRRMIKYGRHELTTGRYIQSEDKILDRQQFIKYNRELLFTVLDELSL